MNVRQIVVAAFIGLAMSKILAADSPETPYTSLPCWNPDLPIEQRVADMVSRLDTKEKIALMYFLQPEIARLGIKAYHLGNEALHGVVRPGKATVFPQAIGMAATWNPELVQRVAAAISDEARAKYNETGGKVIGNYSGLLTFWSPVVNLARDPRWGRTEETYGEDPYLTARIGVAFVKGLQGDDPKYLKVVATPKHFAGNNKEGDRFGSNAAAEERYWRDYELLGFRACVIEGKAESIMGAFNAINGVPCCANKWLLTDVLRNEWGFKGFVVSDCGAIKHLYQSYHVVRRLEEAIALAVNSGIDMDTGGRPYLDAAVNEGLVSKAALDQSVTRILTARFKLGMFDPPERVPFSKIKPEVNGCAQYVALAREVAQQSMVLLKNDAVGPAPLLPIDPAKVKKIVVAGPNAAVCQFGGYSGEPANPPVSPLQGIQARAGKDFAVQHVPWTKDNALTNHLEAIHAADLVVAVLGLSRDYEGEARDRATLNLPLDQEEFIRKLVAENPRVVVVLESGGPLAVNWLATNALAILQAWYPGEQGGNAIADVLFGDVNPSGRLPLTFYKGTEQLRPVDEYDLTKGRTYMYLKDAPLYPFGHGLSYTTFQYSNFKIRSRAQGIGPATAEGGTAVLTVQTNDTIESTIDVANTGSRDGDEVVQVYVRQTDSKVIRPLKQLKAIQRVTIPKGARKTVTVSLAVSDLACWDQTAKNYAVEPGQYEIMVGDIQLRCVMMVR